MNRLAKLILISISVLLASSFSLAQAQSGKENDWPRTLSLTTGTATLYPMQVEEMEGDLIRYRAAISYLEDGQTDPVFGAGWFESTVEIDRNKDVVHPLNFKVTETRFPAGTVDIGSELSAAVDAQMPGWDLDFPVAELLASLETAELEAKSAEKLNTQPPQIIYRDHPALLVNIDGEPVLRSIENSNFQAVINTPYPLIVDGKNYYLNAADDVWYRANSATGPYRFEPNPPAAIAALVDAPADSEQEATDTQKVTAENAPEIVVATRPSELIVTEGPAAFVPLVDDLLVLSNTENDVFMHISTQQYFVVLAGRWYQSKSLNGPWSYRAADELPLAFANIPPESEQAGARVYVAGTTEAKEAVLDAQIPKTAAVERGTVDIDVTYDGEPDFEPVDGTEMQYANNTSSTILQSDRLYYLVEDGVWYVSRSPNGPWEVSDYRPEEVAAISPESPVYNVKYVYVYDSTPEVVYVGYTPGYTGSYVYANTIVYGTGYYYRPYVSPYYYYPRYSTWGFSVGYNPWYGWSFGLSWGWGPFYAGYYSGGYWHNNYYWGGPRYAYGCGYWGPRGYRPRPVHHDRYAYGRGGYDRSAYNDRGYGKGNYHNGRYGRNGGDYGQNRNGRGEYSAYGNGRNDGNGRNGSGGRNGGNTGSGRDSGPGVAENGWTNRYARNDNLYRDRGQRASITPAADITRGRRGNAEQLASNDRNTGKRGQRAAGNGSQDRVKPAKTGRNVTGPVSPSDLRVKAQVRNARVAANQNGSFADNAAASRGRANPAGAKRIGQERQRYGWESASANGEVRPVRKAAPAANQRPTVANTQGPAGSVSQRQVRQSTKPVSSNAGATTTRVSQRDARSAGRQNSAQRSANQQNRSEPQRAVAQRSATPGSATQRSASLQTATQRAAVQRGSSQRSAPQPVASQRATPQRTAPRRVAEQRSAPQRPTPQQRAPQRTVAQRSTPQQAAPQARAPRQAAPQRRAPQQAAPQARAPRQAAPQRSAPQQAAPQARAPRQAAPQRSAPQRAAPQRSAPAPKSSRGNGNRGNSSRSVRKRGD